MNSFYVAAKRFWNDEGGVTAIEYGLIAALIAVVLIAGAALTGTNLNTLFNKIATCLSSPSATCFSGTT